MAFKLEPPKGTDPGPSEFGYGRGLRPDWLLDARPEDGGMYRPLSPPVAEDGRQIRRKRGDGGDSCAGRRTAP